MVFRAPEAGVSAPRQAPVIENTMMIHTHGRAQRPALQINKDEKVRVYPRFFIVFRIERRLLIEKEGAVRDVVDVGARCRPR
jgi:hypothetical protein